MERMTRTLLHLAIEIAILEGIDEELIDQLVTVFFSLEEDDESDS